MNILDNSDSDFNFDLPEGVDAEYVTNKSMSALWDLVIAPMEAVSYTHLTLPTNREV